MSEYKYIPNIVSEYIENIKASHRLLQSLGRDYALVMKSIDILFEKASAITDLAPEELIKSSDFEKTDLDSDRFDAMLAVFRTIVHLDNLGFVEIKPLKAQKKVKEAGLLGKYKDKKWAVAVICLSDEPKRLTHQGIIDYIEEKFKKDKKCEQLHITRNKYNCSYELLVIVMNSPGAVALTDQRDYLIILEDVWVNLGEREDLFLSIVTGRESSRAGIDDCIHPPLP